MMTTLNKNESFATHIGTLTNGIKYEQGGYAFSPSGECLGEMKSGKLVKLKVEPKPKAATEPKVG